MRVAEAATAAVAANKAREIRTYSTPFAGGTSLVLGSWRDSSRGEVGRRHVSAVAEEPAGGVVVEVVMLADGGAAIADQAELFGAVASDPGCVAAAVRCGR